MATVEERLDRIESRIEIDELMSKYCHGFDRPDYDLLRTVWTNDATFDLGPAFGAPSEGIEAIMDKAEELRTVVPVMYHWMADPIVAIKGDTAQASTELNCFVVSRQDGPTQVFGVYADKFERRHGIWKIKHRVFDMQIWAPLGNWAAAAGTKAGQTRI